MWVFSNQILLHEFHMFHAIVAHCSISVRMSLTSILRVGVKKFEIWALLFWTRPLTSAHMFLARGHSHNICFTVSLCCCCWHTAQRGSICIFFFRRLSRVGKIFEHALHTKFLAFDGVFRDHTDFHKRSSAAAKEYSPFDWSSNLHMPTLPRMPEI